MTRTLYTLILRLLAPLLWLWMALRARKSGGRWGIFSRPRFGFSQHPDAIAADSRIWIHAVSLGETRAAQPLIQALLDAGEALLLTHTTPTGRAEGERLFGTALATGQLRQTWLPYDFPGSTRRFFRLYRPRVGVLVEREVWPNLLHQAHQANVPMILASARLSALSLRKTRWLRGALQPAYNALTLTLAQTPEDAAHLIEAGVKDVQVVGNMKFDVKLPSAQIEAGRKWREALGRPVVAIASTREGEDGPFAALIASPTAENIGLRSAEPLYLLIPRHPQRFDAVASILSEHDLPYVRRSQTRDDVPSSGIRVLLGDTLGEMAFYYAAADVAIIGGGFAPLGGQNLIEACAAGTAVIVGPHMHNFAQATRDAIEAGAALQVSNAASALSLASALLSDEDARHQMRGRALTMASSHAGATARIIEALAPWMQECRTPDY
ncbi:MULTISPECIES: 3-deoxy-D-manno-octulosonic acid transferase [unclassified Achromobacter]|uniref:3-deoxy-D-manno-octulosonic acid transferase n=1 Tax=unclassified Achromobacter TaxID=2626865 RepID=UPI000B5184B8|nr:MULTISPECIES: 3-deoxy-D-manno-octulosonic acid transferase [unclassified Achromobacter]OWT75081.1 3-deoxy-D-manno-octulosonic acid transferase [Achromobacter sp. HZ28]OWT76778.1 3-deoxy-D-manno-octulosonic acid transferase [Achromobacter sp. HZ34]